MVDVVRREPISPILHGAHDVLILCANLGVAYRQHDAEIVLDGRVAAGNEILVCVDQELIMRAVKVQRHFVQRR